MLLCQLSVCAEPPLSEQRWEAESARDGVLSERGGGEGMRGPSVDLQEPCT